MAKTINGGSGVNFITAITQDINKLMKMGDIAFNFGEQNPLKIKYWYSTGIPMLDIIIRGTFGNEETCIGGIPAGRYIKIDGETGGGKSLIAWNVASDCIRKGGVVLYFDIEKAITEEFADAINVPREGVVLVPFVETLEKIFEVIGIFIKRVITDKVPHALIVIDSVTSMMTEDEIEDEDTIGASNYGRKAKLMGEVLRKLSRALAENNISIILLNQLRANLKKVNKYDDDWMVPTAIAQDFWSQVTLRVYKSSLLKSEKMITGQKLRIVTKKSRYTAHGKEIKVDLDFKTGLQNEGAIFEALKAIKKVVPAGSKGNRIIIDNGKEFTFKAENFKEIYLANLDLQNFAIKSIEETYDKGDWFDMDQDQVMLDKIENKDFRQESGLEVLDAK